MAPLRSDAARNHARILDAARSLAGNGEPLALNAVARAAEVGVGTVYRHFATTSELEETLVWDRFDDLAEILDSTGPDHLERALTAVFTLLAQDPVFEAVTSRPQPALEQTAARQQELLERLAQVLDHTRAAGALKEGIDAPAVLMLMCGLAHSVRNNGVDADGPQARMLLRVVFDGLRP
jgi:AcrR family transcriptional regulator